MLTKVFLEGPLGKKFGREWEFDISSPAEALRMVDANEPGVFAWIKANLRQYSRYKVLCKYENSGKVEALGDEEYQMLGKPIEIRFVPLIEGAGAVGRVVLGIVLVVAGVYFQQPWMVQAGVGMIVGGVVQLLVSQPEMGGEQVETKNRTSYYFDGPVNTTQQGVPVQLIYGQALVGSHAISAEVSIDQL